MYPVTPTITLTDADIEIRQIRASGPGGQNVNKLATAVQLRFDAEHCQALSPSIRRRLKHLAGSRMTAEGILILTARSHRSAERNRADALDRLADLIRLAAVPPKPRRKTRVPRAAKRRRLESKRHRGQTKSQRRPSDQ